MDARARQFEDRLDGSHYADDPLRGVYTSLDDPDAVWLPDRLLERLTFLGRAYSLHTLGRLGGEDDFVLNQLQGEALVWELGFVATVVANDPLVSEAVTRLQGYLRRVFALNPAASVTVDGC